MREKLRNLLQQEDLNFFLTNRIPRRALTRFMGWFSRIRHPVVRVPSIWAFRFFADDLELGDARKRSFSSLHDCFIRQLKAGARPVDARPDIAVSPCDAIVGACGRVDGTELIQAKGCPYTLEELLQDPALVARHANGQYVTLRLKASMYHRFHAPHDCLIERITYISGDVWNVNPIALRRVPGLYAQNERAIIRTTLRGGALLTLVPVAAVLVASIRFTFTDVRLHLKYSGPNEIPCGKELLKGQEMGHFEHGSTIIVFGPPGFGLTPNVREGLPIRMGAPLFEISRE
jgi:phosphatidylserine decarboxylase